MPHRGAVGLSRVTVVAEFSGLLTDGLAVQDGFLSHARVRELIECMEWRRGRGEFSAARVGVQTRVARREEIRGDWTCWLAEPLLPAERALLEDLEGVRLRLNREAYLGLFDLEIHYAWYPPGAGYARHVDQPQRREQRKVSLIVYLNVGWEAETGGQLRIFGTDDGYRDIEPVAGRLVCFLTMDREHAVLPTGRERLSISGWFRCRD